MNIIGGDEEIASSCFDTFHILMVSYRELRVKAAFGHVSSRVEPEKGLINAIPKRAVSSSQHEEIPK